MFTSRKVICSTCWLKSDSIWNHEPTTQLFFEKRVFVRVKPKHLTIPSKRFKFWWFNMTTKWNIWCFKISEMSWFLENGDSIIYIKILKCHKIMVIRNDSPRIFPIHRSDFSGFGRCPIWVILNITVKYLLIYRRWYSPSLGDVHLGHLPNPVSVYHNPQMSWNYGDSTSFTPFSHSFPQTWVRFLLFYIPPGPPKYHRPRDAGDIRRHW